MASTVALRGDDPSPRVRVSDALSEKGMGKYDVHAPLGISESTERSSDRVSPLARLAPKNVPSGTCETVSLPSNVSERRMSGVAASVCSSSSYMYCRKPSHVWPSIL